MWPRACPIRPPLSAPSTGLAVAAAPARRDACSPTRKRVVLAPTPVPAHFPWPCRRSRASSCCTSSCRRQKPRSSGYWRRSRGWKHRFRTPARPTLLCCTQHAPPCKHAGVGGAHRVLRGRGGAWCMVGSNARRGRCRRYTSPHVVGMPRGAGGMCGCGCDRKSECMRIAPLANRPPCIHTHARARTHTHTHTHACASR